MSGRPRTEATDVASAFDQSKVNQVNYVQSSDPNDPNMVYLPGSSGPINLKPAKYDAQTFETPWAKLVRKCKQQPAVPIFLGATCAAITMAFVEMRRGNKRKMQLWLRYRVFFQGITVLGIVGGGALYKRQEIEQERKAFNAQPSDQVIQTVRSDAQRFSDDADWQQRLAALEQTQQSAEERERHNRELVMAQLIAQDQARERVKSRMGKVGLGTSASQAGEDPSATGEAAQGSQDGTFVSTFKGLFGGNKQE